MSADATNSFLDYYVAWLRENSSEQVVDDGWVSLTVPFLDRHNDYLQVFVRRDSEGYHITDDGQTFNDLKHIGCDLTGSPRRREIAERILRLRGLDPHLVQEQAITSVAINGDFPGKLHHVFLSMLALDGLAHVTRPNIVTSFKDDVTKWLTKRHLPFTRPAKYAGSRSTEHVFDYRLDGQRGSPDRILQAIPDPDKVHVQSFVYEVNDTRAALGDESLEFWAVVNDESRLNKKSKEALMGNGVRYFGWSNREEMAIRLAS